MPRIMFKNIAKADVEVISKELSQTLSTIISCPEDWLTFEHSENTVYISGEEKTSTCIFVEIAWFKRSQEIQDKVATAIYAKLRGKYQSQKEVTIIFHELKEVNYYEEGKHY